MNPEHDDDFDPLDPEIEEERAKRRKDAEKQLLQDLKVVMEQRADAEPFSGSSNFVRCRRALLRFSRWLWRLLLVSATSVLLFGLESKPLVQSYLN